MNQNLTEVRGAAVAGALRVLARVTPFIEPELIGLRDVVRPGDVCVDIGAALGLYTVSLSRLVGPHGRVHSVEPLVFAHPALSYLLRPREGRNVVRHCVALGTREGQDVMSVPVRHGLPVTGRSFLTAGADGLGSNVEFDQHLEVLVRTDTLDRFCAANGIERLDFVKADVEGAELRVLQGGADTIERFRPKLLLEVEERHVRRFGYRSQDLVEWLAERGYRMHAWQRNAWQQVDRIRPDVRNYLFRP
ncbi:FkbM family methyltransferase [Saccharothrix tamanrassetensis]|uniref:FkbM family methyltransferase n=1 Tax=Saccharothrix tamanrassetensis TaxID=1051531 RepID=A0A841CHD6_9PSEU|nr:FkbM family methyltransferase [Saccharothrix tamanrassetensis]MBB5956403.1 FkbM family methyltransferase [Saccharothrix tamanrassetensis]